MGELRSVEGHTSPETRVHPDSDNPLPTGAVMDTMKYAAFVDMLRKGANE